MKNIYKIGFMSLLGLGLIAAPKMALATDTANGTSTASVVTPITVVATTPEINFGSFSGGAGGTLVVTANASGPAVVTQTGDVAILDSAAAQAAFTVSGSGTSAYTFTITSGGDLSTTETGTNTTMTPTYNDTATGALTGGTEIVYVGASLAVAADQTAGTYTGTYLVTVNNN